MPQDFSRLLPILTQSKVQQDNPALYQVVATLINGAIDFSKIQSSSSSTGGSAGLRKASVLLTNNQILDLPNTYITCVPACGFNQYNLLFRWDLIINALAGAYIVDTTPNNNGFSVAYGDWAVDGSTFDRLSGAADILIFTGGPFVDVSTGLYPPYSNGPLTLGGIRGLPMKLIAWNNVTPSFGGGNAANTGKLTVYYTVESA